ncbi:MAG: carbohydrate-binding domain-containing protein, partial [Armatimonadota bacterium]
GFSSQSVGLVSVLFPGHIGGSYVAAEGDSPIGSGQWLHYGLSNQSGESKRFTPHMRYASIGDSLVHLEIDGVNQTGPVILPGTTSANVWKTVSLADVTLSGGSNVLKLVFDDGACYVDSIDFRLERPKVALADDAALVSEDVAYNLNSAVPTVNTITMRNTGASTWTADGEYGLACGNELDSTTWYPVSAAVPPGGEYTFRFIGPISPATVKLFLPKWQMKRQSTGYFGTQVTRPQRSTDFVQVTSSAKLVSDDIPVRLGSAESAQIHVTVRNVGIGAWKGVDVSDYSGLYLADAVFGTANTGPRVSSGEQVAPGGDRTFRVVIQGPASPGVYTLRMRMYRNGYGFFGPYIVRQIEVVTDASPPGKPLVTDDGISTTDFTSLHATWASSYDSQSGITGYSYAIGTSLLDPGTGYVTDWTSVGTALAVTRSNLQLLSGVTYYFYVKAQNGAGMWSVAGVSDGILVVDPKVTIADVQAMPIGRGFVLPEKMVAYAGGGLVFLEEPDRSRGIKLNWNGAEPSRTQKAAVAGVYRGIVNYEPTADAVAVNPGSAGVLMPLGTNNKSIGWPGAGTPPYSGVDTRCLLIRTWGKVTYQGAGYFLVDDGSGISDHKGATGKNGLKVLLPSGAQMPFVGQLVIVTGLSRALVGSERWVMPRDPSDIQ